MKTVPKAKYLINLKGLDPVTAAPYACSGVTTYSALKKVESVLHHPIVIFGAGALVTSERIHKLLGPISVICFGAYIALLFTRLG